MTPAELDELEQVVGECTVADIYVTPLEGRYYVAMPGDDLGALAPEHNALIIAAVKALPALIAKVRAAEAMAEAVETKLSYSTGPVVVAAIAFRKAGQ